MRKIVVLLLLVLSPVLLTACGGEDEPSATIYFMVDPGGGDAYTDLTRTSRSSGEVKLQFNNRQPDPHDLAIEDSSGNQLGKTDVVREGVVSTTVELEPGEDYTFYCTVPGHREYGMEGTLTVKQ